MKRKMGLIEGEAKSVELIKISKRSGNRGETRRDFYATRNL
jgi:hypothetical protein